MRALPMVGSGFIWAFLMVGSTLMLGACTTGVEDMAYGGEGQEDIGTAQQTISWGWTPYTSDEYAPINCDGGGLMSGVQCTGSYCDNVRAYCQPTGHSFGSSFWTNYFSEEGVSRRYCGGGYWVTGIACSGDYCDNISLQCSAINGTTLGNCYWTGWVSEEYGGYLFFGNGYYAAGAECNGSYCDNMRFYVCQLGS